MEVFEIIVLHIDRFSDEKMIYMSYVKYISCEKSK